MKKKIEYFYSHFEITSEHKIKLKNIVRISNVIYENGRKVVEEKCLGRIAPVKIF